MASRPWWVARKNIAVPAALATPVTRLSRRVPAGGRRRSRVTTATPVTVTIAASWEMVIGHRSVLDPARSRPMKNSPNPAPAASPHPTPAAWRPVAAGRKRRAAGPCCPGGVVPRAARPCWRAAVTAWDPTTAGATSRLALLAGADTPTIAGTASKMPASESAVGRSPSARPASTENTAVPTALTELATLNAACRNPRYSAIAPATPLAPAQAPQSTDVSDGAWLLTNGITHRSRAAAATSASTVTRTTLACRVASPAAKSEPPYPAAAASASKTASIDQVLLCPGQGDRKARRSRTYIAPRQIRDGRGPGGRAATPRVTWRAGAAPDPGEQAGSAPPGRRARSRAGRPPWGGTAPASSGPARTAGRCTAGARRSRAAARRTGTGPLPWPAPRSAWPGGTSASAGSSPSAQPGSGTPAGR